MARINKVKRDKAIAALKKAGASTVVAASMWRLLDLDENLDPQIAELVEEDPEMFAPDADEEPDDAERSMTVREATDARLKGNSEHMVRKAYRRTAEPRPSTASKSAQEAAAHLRKNSTRNPPPVRKYIAELPDLNAHAKQFDRERPANSSANKIADRLRGN